MPLRFWRRIKVAPGVSLNVSRSGASVSVGPRGAKLTFGHGKVRQTVGLPGSGLFYTRTLPAPAADPHPAAPPDAPASAVPAAPVPWRATLLVMALLTAFLATSSPPAALALALLGTPVALLLAWLLRRHPLALGLIVVALAVAALAIVVGAVVGVLAAGASGGRRRRRRW